MLINILLPYFTIPLRSFIAIARIQLLETRNQFGIDTLLFRGREKIPPIFLEEKLPKSCSNFFAQISDVLYPIVLSCTFYHILCKHLSTFPLPDNILPVNIPFTILYNTTPVSTHK